MDGAAVRPHRRAGLGLESLRTGNRDAPSRERSRSRSPRSNARTATNIHIDEQLRAHTRSALEAAAARGVVDSLDHYGGSVHGTGDATIALRAAYRADVHDASERDAVIAAVRDTGVEALADIVPSSSAKQHVDVSHFSAIFAVPHSGRSARNDAAAATARASTEQASAVAERLRVAAARAADARRRAATRETDDRFIDTDSEDEVSTATAAQGVGAAGNNTEASALTRDIQSAAEGGALVRTPAAAEQSRRWEDVAEFANSKRDVEIGSPGPPLYAVLRAGHFISVDCDGVPRRACVVAVTHGGYAIASYRVRFVSTGEYEDDVRVTRCSPLEDVDYTVTPQPAASGEPQFVADAAVGRIFPVGRGAVDAVEVAVGDAAALLAEVTAAAPTSGGASGSNGAVEERVVNKLCAVLPDERFDGVASRARPPCLVHVGIVATHGSGRHVSMSLNHRTICPHGDLCRLKHVDLRELAQLRSRAAVAAASRSAAAAVEAEAAARRARLSAVNDLQGASLVAQGLLSVATSGVVPCVLSSDAERTTAAITCTPLAREVDVAPPPPPPPAPSELPRMQNAFASNGFASLHAAGEASCDALAIQPNTSSASFATQVVMANMMRPAMSARDGAAVLRASDAAETTSLGTGKVVPPSGDWRSRIAARIASRTT